VATAGGTTALVASRVTPVSVGDADTELITTADLLDVVDEGVVVDGLQLERPTLNGILEVELTLLLHVAVHGLLELVLLVESDELNEALVGGEGHVVPGDIGVVEGNTQQVESGDTQDEDRQTEWRDQLEDTVLGLEVNIVGDLQPVQALTPGSLGVHTRDVLREHVVGETVQVVDGLHGETGLVLGGYTIVLGSQVGVLSDGLQVVGLLAHIVVAVTTLANGDQLFGPRQRLSSAHHLS